MAREIMLVLVNDVHEKISQTVETDKILRACTSVTTLHSCCNFAYVLHENALVFNQSEPPNFSMCIIHPLPHRSD